MFMLFLIDNLGKMDVKIFANDSEQMVVVPLEQMQIITTFDKSTSKIL